MDEFLYVNFFFLTWNVPVMPSAAQLSRYVSYVCFRGFICFWFFLYISPPTNYTGKEDEAEGAQTEIIIDLIT